MRLKNLFLAFLLFIISVQSFADQRRAQIIGIIDQELREVTRLNQRTGAQNPEYLLRMAELLLEKARHLKDEENERFLRMSPEQRQRVNREEFFKRSHDHFVQAQRTGLHIIRNFPNFPERGEVLYILAYNSKEFQRTDDARRYFAQAIQSSRPGSETHAKAQLGLAEIYYNEQNYRRAAPLYEQALRVIDDQWWTKDSFNLAWSYFRLGEHRRAINLMNEIHRKSADSKYVDMRPQVERDIAYFYTEAGDIQQAVAFYQRQGGDIATNLIRVGRHMISQGKHTAAQNAFEEALKHRRTREDNIEIHLQLLNIHEKFLNYPQHLASSQQLMKFHEGGHLRPDQLEDLKYHVQNMSARLQRQVAEGRRGARHERDQQQRAQMAVAYFELFGRLDPAQSYQANFHAAETNFASRNFNDAVRLYNLAYQGAIETNNREIAHHALEGMMASLGSEGITEETLNTYLEPAYLAFLQANSRGEQSNLVFQRLFNHYKDKGDIRNAERTFNSYRRNFPDQHDIHEAMLGHIMDHYQQRRDLKNLNRWAARIESGEIQVSRQYAETVRLLLLNLQFEQVEKFTSEGDMKEALRGYVMIYQSDQSSEDAKKNAAYNIATLFHELGDIERTYGWTKRALEHMDAQDVHKFESSFMAITTGLFHRRAVKQAAEINSSIFLKLCQINSNNKSVFFRNANVMLLATDQYQESMQLIQRARQCQITRDVIALAQEEQLAYLLSKEYWNGLEDYIERLKGDVSNRPELIYPLSKVRDALLRSGQTTAAREKESEIINFYMTSLAQNLTFPIEALDVVAEIRLRRVRQLLNQINAIELRFPEDNFNNQLEDLFEKLDTFTDAALEILQIGSGEGIVTAYRYLVEGYENSAQKIELFTPQDRSDEYVASFRESMRGIYNPLYRQAQSFRDEAVGHIKGSEILSTNNYWFLNHRRDSIYLKFFDTSGGILMDRGGRR